jgi:hypothetical protein
MQVQSVQSKLDCLTTKLDVQCAKSIGPTLIVWQVPKESKLAPVQITQPPSAIIADFTRYTTQSASVWPLIFKLAFMAALIAAVTAPFWLFR